MQITSLHSLNAFLLPIKTVGVQVNGLIPGVFWKPLPPARQLQWSAKRCFVIENKGLDLRTWSSGDWDSYIIVGAKVSRQLNRHWSEWQVWCLRISLALNNPGHIWAVSSWLQNLVGLCCIPPAPFMAEKSWTELVKKTPLLLTLDHAYCPFLHFLEWWCILILVRKGARAGGSGDRNTRICAVTKRSPNAKLGSHRIANLGDFITE